MNWSDIIKRWERKRIHYCISIILSIILLNGSLLLIFDHFIFHLVLLIPYITYFLLLNIAYSLGYLVEYLSFIIRKHSLSKKEFKSLYRVGWLLTMAFVLADFLILLSAQRNFEMINGN